MSSLLFKVALLASISVVVIRCSAISSALQSRSIEKEVYYCRDDDEVTHCCMPVGHWVPTGCTKSPLSSQLCAAFPTCSYVNDGLGARSVSLGKIREKHVAPFVCAQKHKVDGPGGRGVDQEGSWTMPTKTKPDCCAAVDVFDIVHDSQGYLCSNVEGQKGMVCSSNTPRCQVNKLP